MEVQTMRQTMRFTLRARGISTLGTPVSEVPTPVQGGSGAHTPAAQSGPGV